MIVKLIKIKGPSGLLADLLKQGQRGHAVHAGKVLNVCKVAWDRTGWEKQPGVNSIKKLCVVFLQLRSAHVKFRFITD